MSTLRRKSRFTTVLMWAMIALSVFGGLPRLGCICANGQHKVFCERRGNCDAGARCICCFGKATAKTSNESGSQNAPSGELACCRRARALRQAMLPAFAAGRPCRQVVDQSVLLTDDKPSLDLDGADSTPLFVALGPLPAVASYTATDFNRGELLPPPDLVVRFGVLLI